MDLPYVVGIDIGGQTAKIGLVDIHGGILEKTAMVSNTQLDAKTFLDDLAQAITEMVNKNYSMDDVRGIGVGAPNANFYTGMISHAPNLTWAKTSKVAFKKELSKRLGKEVTVTNDANAAAMGEMTYGTARSMKDFIVITLGTGVGAGIVIDGKLVYGHDGYAGELGHTTVVRGKSGRLCGCGRTGCLEAYCSATGVARTAREILEQTDEKSLLRNIPIENLTSKDVYDAAVNNDQVAIKIFERTGTLLGEALTNFVVFSSPEAIILFGGLMRAGRFIFNPIQEAMEKNMLPLWKGKVDLLVSALKESDAAILGASALAW